MYQNVSETLRKLAAELKNFDPKEVMTLYKKYVKDGIPGEQREASMTKMNVALATIFALGSLFGVKVQGQDIDNYLANLAKPETVQLQKKDVKVEDPKEQAVEHALKVNAEIQKGSASETEKKMSQQSADALKKLA